jgi:hypothetical protein
MKLKLKGGSMNMLFTVPFSIWEKQWQASRNPNMILKSTRLVLLTGENSFSFHPIFSGNRFCETETFIFLKVAICFAAVKLKSLQSYK